MTAVTLHVFNYTLECCKFGYTRAITCEKALKIEYVTYECKAHVVLCDVSNRHPAYTKLDVI